MIVHDFNVVIGDVVDLLDKVAEHVLSLRVADFRRSHHGVNARAPSCCLSLDKLFGIPTEPSGRLDE